ncbi:MAG: hypothetical protein E6G85_05915 [Alphaproteobacteria bacterium]|nr:MAG: hypothetical protein E6G85_05915 [Alphaproteobacteria bacterium]
MNNRDISTSENSPLVDYALKGLDRLWLPEFGRWSHIYHLDNRSQPNESVPPSDVFYTLNVLLGMARVRRVPRNINLSETFQQNVRHLLTLPVSKYALGVALWAGAELGLALPDDVLRHIDGMLSDRNQWRSFRAQDLGMIVVGVVGQAKVDRKKWSPIATGLFAFLLDRYYSPSGLFFDAAFGPRRRYASFATQTYLLLACYAYGELMNDDRAIQIANTCSRKLIERQGPNGEWPWFFDAARGQVLDFYEVYSVHQYGMAPAFLELAERHGVFGARSAIIKGFNWVFGQNQLATPMLVPHLHLTIRSQVRKGELHTKKWRVVRALRNSMLRREAVLVDPSELELRLECRSYELGWILWSFGQRSDCPELTHNQMFMERCQKIT